ncbi:MAG TPA: cytochrome P450 [Solirubrobacterales bacterium]|nr:cytochrome P450 [Solirubrobacterales bacterium]
MSVSNSRQLSEINLADIDSFADGPPHWAFRLLRKEAPVSWQEVPDFLGHWAIVKHADVVRVSKDPQTFTSEKGILVESDHKNPPPDQELAVVKDMIETDPPRHNRIRALVNREFTPKQIAALEPEIRFHVDELLDAVDTSGDFVEDVASQLPMRVICQLMGVPVEDRAHLIDLFNWSFGSDDPEFQVEGLSAIENRIKFYEEMIAYLEAHLTRQRERLDSGDVGSMLASAEIDGDRLSDEEILAFYHLLLAAGSETTRTGAAGGVKAFFDYPDQWARLQADRSLIDTAVDEILRWTSPIMGFSRVANVDTVVGGQPIAAGDKLHLWYASANRDEEVFEQSESFDVGRSPNNHLAFGVGTHFCLGSSLARLELRLLFEGLLDRFPGLEPAGEAEHLRNLLTPALKRLPVTYVPNGG